MYRGQNVIIPLGDGGITSDVPQSRVPPTQLIEAKNVALYNGFCEKHPGSRPWNRDNPITGSTTISGGIQTFLEYFPTPFDQRVIVLSKTGELYKFTSPIDRVKLTPQSATAAPAILSTTFEAHLAAGGGEIAGQTKKCFIFSGGSQVQVIVGDGTTYRPITNPAVDWSTSYPKYGLIYRSRLWCFGNENAADFLYASAEDDQENFVPPVTPGAKDAQFFDVSPGDQHGISGLFVFKNRLYICKYPTGLFQLNDEDSNSANWYITRVNADFGLSSSHGIAQVFDDVFIFNTQGTVTSVAAAFQFGDIESADLFNKIKVERYFREDVSGFGIRQCYALYYQDKKQVYFTYRSKSSLNQDKIIVMNLSGQVPQVTVSDKDQPNCLGLITDVSGISRPVYGSNSGNLYEMDAANRQVTVQPYSGIPFYVGDPLELPTYTTAYYEDLYASNEVPYNFVAQTPHLDFSYADPTVGLKNKRWDFLELTFQPTGDWVVDCDVYIDSEFSETIQFNLKRDRPLAPTTPPASVINGFQLDNDKLEGDVPKSIRKPLHGQGRTISFKLRSAGLSQNIKLQSLMVYFRVSDERQIKDPRTT